MTWEWDPENARFPCSGTGTRSTRVSLTGIARIFQRLRGCEVGCLFSRAIFVFLVCRLLYFLMVRRCDEIENMLIDSNRFPQQQLAQHIPRHVRRLMHRRHLPRRGAGAPAPDPARIWYFHPPWSEKRTCGQKSRRAQSRFGVLDGKQQASWKRESHLATIAATIDPGNNPHVAIRRGVFRNVVGNVLQRWACFLIHHFVSGRHTRWSNWILYRC